ncbi:MAG: cytochrome P450 [Ktedonobacteraceae bacterium]|nr:cytochrome P450 [Ktedonobacteraceae bacterium]
MTTLTFGDLIGQEIEHNPYPFYQKLREQGPLSSIADFGGMGGAWIATNYEDALIILKDPRFLKDARLLRERQDYFLSDQAQGPFQGEISWKNALLWRRDMLLVDPPDHGRLRGLASSVFTPRMIEQWRPRVQQITDELLDVVQEQRTMDVIADFAYPLPITVIADILGIPFKDRKLFLDWTQSIAHPPQGPEQEAAQAVAGEAFLDYLKALLAEKRTHPGDDLTTGLVQAKDTADALSETELISTILLLILAGHETTLNLIGTGTLALLQHPDQLRLLQQDTSLLPSAIEELLRYSSPVSMTSPRWAGEDISLHDKVIRKGELVFVSLIAVNTDPQQFSHPETLDLTRQVNKHLAFGRGIHVCLGAPLARMEGQIAFSTLLRRLPDLQLACDPAQLFWNPYFALRGPMSLPVTF